MISYWRIALDGKHFVKRISVSSRLLWNPNEQATGVNVAIETCILSWRSLWLVQYAGRDGEMLTIPEHLIFLLELIFFLFFGFLPRVVMSMDSHLFHFAMFRHTFWGSVWFITKILSVAVHCEDLLTCKDYIAITVY